jgi:protein arginine kinase
MANHLALQWVDCKGFWEQAWNTLNRIETAIGSQTEYAFSPQFGYLTSLPDLCGTSLVVLCYLHLPALIFSEKLEDVLEGDRLETIKISSFSGGTAEFIGDFIILQNKLTLGVSEETILNDLYTLAKHLLLCRSKTR